MSLALTRAFSLIDVAFLNSFLAAFLIASLVLDQNLDILDKQRDADSEIEIISNHLTAYWYKNQKLPCPSYPEKDIFDDQAKSEVRDSEGCVPSYGVAESGQGEYYVGSLPIANLNLDMDYLMDPWGSKYVYLVRQDLTEEGSVLNKELINHVAKDVIWFSAAQENISSNNWHADRKISGEVIDVDGDFEIFQLEEEEYVRFNKMHMDLDLYIMQRLILFDGIFNADFEFVLSLDSAIITLSYDEGICIVRAEGEQDYDHEKEVSCTEHNYFSFHYDVMHNTLFFMFNNNQLFDIPITFADLNLDLATNNRGLLLQNIIISQEQYSDLISRYVEQYDLPEYTDVTIINSAAQPIDFSFIVMSNLRNRYSSYNNAGVLLTKGYDTENLMAFDDSFLPKTFEFLCSDLTSVCSVINKDLDYSLKLKNLL